jgi:hypothetical protein
MNEEQLKEIFSDEAFTSYLLALDTPESVQAALKEKGLDLTLDEIALLNQNLEIAMENGNELTEEQLAQVSSNSLILLNHILYRALVVAIVGLPTTGFIRRRW